MQGKYTAALERYKEALQIADQLGDLAKKAIGLTNIADISKLQGKYPEALKHLEAALKIDEQLGDLSGKANGLTNIGTIYTLQGKYSEALKQYEAALVILNQLGLGNSLNAKRFKENIQNIKLYIKVRYFKK